MTRDNEDIGLTHIALAVRDIIASRIFYERYARLHIIHERHDVETGQSVLWMSDLRRRFALVLVEKTNSTDTPLGPFGHIGVACDSREEVDRLASVAEVEGLLRSGPSNSPPPVGYWAFIQDPDGNTLELSSGQQIEWSVKVAKEIKQTAAGACR